ncbi:MAG: methyltransferase domain-containing protein [Alphaproteobacteria bacterium]|nr:methyltransferase domain-containing protein [Alphaproteobacteria bacterium]
MSFHDFDEFLAEGKKPLSFKDGIPRFTPDESYSTGNFALLRENHATLQLDSKNGTTDRRDTILDRTKWSPEFFKGKTILECGCGAGPDTEILRGFGARVMAVDIAGVDIAKRNLGDDDGVQFVQASIMDLPFKPQSFDIVFCHRVIMHTPAPEKTLDHILQFVKPGGAIFIHSYASGPAQTWRWKYPLRPFTKKLDPEKLYNFICGYAHGAFKVTSALRKIPGGRVINHVLIPFMNFRHAKQFKNLTDEQVIEIGVHDTFDALSPPYDKPIPPQTMLKYAHKHGLDNVELEKRQMVTLLRTKAA